MFRQTFYIKYAINIFQCKANETILITRVSFIPEIPCVFSNFDDIDSFLPCKLKYFRGTLQCLYDPMQYLFNDHI